MTNFLAVSKLTTLLLLLTAVSFSSCEDDDDILGVDLNDDGTLFISSNTSGLVSVVDTRDSDNFEVQTFSASGTDADGIFFNEREGTVFQIDRTNNQIVQYLDVLDDINDEESVDVGIRSPADGFSNGRGLTVTGNSQFVVAEDDNDDGDDDDRDQLVFYSLVNDTNIERIKSVRVPFNVWGIQIDGLAMYAVADNSDSLAILNGVFDVADGDTAAVARYIKIDGITRTHGLEYYPQDDIMLLTDIGDAGSTDNDGAIIVIRDFSTLRDRDVITSADYTRIAGPATMLNNPVDVAFDEDQDRIYVAERANEMLLRFDLDQTGDAAPTQAVPIPGISSLFLNND